MKSLLKAYQENKDADVLEGTYIYIRACTITVSIIREHFYLFREVKWDLFIMCCGRCVSVDHFILYILYCIINLYTKLRVNVKRIIVYDKATCFCRLCT